MEITPIGPRVLIKPIQKKEKTDSGIYLPQDAQNKKKEGVVVKAGTTEQGEKIPLKQGDHILYGGYSNEEFTLEGEEYIILEYKDVLAQVK